MNRAGRAARYGRLTERGTLWLLWLQGWELVDWRIKLGRYELDLVMTRGDELRLVEVKARGRGSRVAADLALGYAQRRRLQMALARFLDQAPWPGRITFQRVCWAGWHPAFHPPERWDSLHPRA